MVTGRVRGNAIQPGARIVDRHQPGAGAPGASECLLGQVFRDASLAYQPVKIIENGGLIVGVQPLNQCGRVAGTGWNLVRAGHGTRQSEQGQPGWDHRDGSPEYDEPQPTTVTELFAAAIAQALNVVFVFAPVGTHLDVQLEENRVAQQALDLV